MWRFSHLLAVPDQLPDGGFADLILALGVSLRRDGLPSTSTLAVARCAAQLFVQGYAPTILLSGGYSQQGVSEASAMRRILADEGISEHILLDESPAHVFGTQHQPRTAAQIFRTQMGEWPSRIILIAHPRHLPRALWLFRRSLSGIAIFPMNAPEVYDPASVQLRLRGPKRFILWNLLAWTHHWLFRHRKVIEVKSVMLLVFKAVIISQVWFLKIAGSINGSPL